MYLRFTPLQMQKLESSELRAPGCLVQHKLCLPRPAGPLIELSRRAGLEQHDAAGVQSGHAAPVDIRSQLRGEVTENRQDTAPGIRIDVICFEIRMRRRNRRAALHSQPLRLLKPNS
jgi:hypothetical protein